MGFGTLGTDAGAVSTSGDYGVFGTAGGSSGIGRNNASGVAGDSADGNGVIGTSGNGYGVGGASSTSVGVDGWSGSGVGVQGRSSTGWAGYFKGDVKVEVNLYAGTVQATAINKDACSFKLDHPLAPADKYLYHSVVESPDMMNIYNGNVTLDMGGEALVELPAWFEALNQDFRYQLTPIGSPAPRLHVAERIYGNRFKIAGGEPGTEVSWQVTGVRHDAYAVAHRIRVEEEKPLAERGCYLHPELFGQPPERTIERAQRPRLPEWREDPVESVRAGCAG